MAKSDTTCYEDLTTGNRSLDVEVIGLVCHTACPITRRNHALDTSNSLIDWCDAYVGGWLAEPGSSELASNWIKLVPYGTNLVIFKISFSTFWLAPNWARLAPNGTNLALFKISFSSFWLGGPKCSETDLKKSQICPIWNRIWSQPN